MGLLDGIEKATGFAAAAYLRGGRTLGEVQRVSFSEDDGSGNLKNGFRLDVRVLHSTNSQNEVGTTRTANIGFRFPNSARPNMVRMLLALMSSNEERNVSQSEITKEKVLELTGPKQPLMGTPIAIEAIETFSDTRKTPKNPEGVFTKYEAYVPTDADALNLEAA